MTYRLGDIIIDPGDVWRFDGVSHVLLTHVHFDHISGLNELLKVSPSAKVYTNGFGRDALLDPRKNMSFYHGDSFVFAHPESIVVLQETTDYPLPDVSQLSERPLDSDVQKSIVIANGTVAHPIYPVSYYLTPGHNPSCVTWVVGDAVFSGDAYIPGVRTVTKLPYGNKADAVRSEQLIRHLVKSRNLYPGHHIDPSLAKVLR